MESAMLRSWRGGGAIEVSTVISSGFYRLATTMNGQADANGEDASLRWVADDVYVGMDHAKAREARGISSGIGATREGESGVRRLSWCSMRWGDSSARLAREERGFWSLELVSGDLLGRFPNSVRSPIVCLSSNTSVYFSPQDLTRLRTSVHNS